MASSNKTPTAAPMFGVVAVNCAQRVALTEGGEVCPITNLFDPFGDETDDFEEATSAVAKLDADHWFSIDLTQFDLVRVN
jgi:hypothetical protein